MACSVVVLGSSETTVTALELILSRLPKQVPFALAIAHTGELPATALDERLRFWSTLPIKQIEDKESVVPGYVYVAPLDYHVLLESSPNEPCRFALSTEAAVYSARPSIDILFSSAAVALGDHVVGVLIKAAEGDGAAGLAAIQQHGGVALANEPASEVARLLTNLCVPPEEG